MISTKLIGSLFVATTLALSVNTALAKPKSGSKAETAYEGAPSGIDTSELKNYMDSEGPKMTVEEVIELMKQSTIVNMVGHNVVKKAIEKGLIHPDAVLKISGIPHAQIIRM